MLKIRSRKMKSRSLLKPTHLDSVLFNRAELFDHSLPSVTWGFLIITSIVDEFLANRPVLSLRFVA